MFVNFAMKKLILRWGANMGIRFSKEEQKILGIKEGDVIDISDIVVIKGGDDGSNPGKRKR